MTAMLVTVGLVPRERLSVSVHPAAHPDAVTASALLHAVADCMSPNPARRNIDRAHARVLAAGQRAAAHALDMPATDHWFDNAPLWADLGRAAGPGWDADAARMQQWYPDQAAAA
ncbi:hypothetical protein ACWC9T_11910 [Kitasatospora sp. NPDC001159]